MKKRLVVLTMVFTMISCYLFGCSRSQVEEPVKEPVDSFLDPEKKDNMLPDLSDPSSLLSEDTLKTLDDIYNNNNNKENEKPVETTESSYEYINNNTIKRDDITPLYDWYTDRSYIEKDRIKSDMKPSVDYGTDSDELIFTEEICGHIMSVSYEFNSDNKLISIAAYFVEKAPDTIYATCFKDIYMECEKAYGMCTTQNPDELRSILDDPDAYAKAATPTTKVNAQWGKEYSEEQTINLIYTRTIHVDYADVIFMYACPNYSF